MVGGIREIQNYSGIQDVCHTCPRVPPAHFMRCSMNHSMTLSDFKSIFFWEWGHRVLGRVIGLTFIFPLAYFVYKRQIPKRLTYSLTGLSLLIGAQGALGWYMVKSGLEDEILTTGAVPRVSQYRLAAHLGTAFLLYVGMFWHGMAIVKDSKFANGKAWSGLIENGKDGIETLTKVLADPKVTRFKRLSWGLTGLVFLTALSGAASTLHAPPIPLLI